MCLLYLFPIFQICIMRMLRHENVVRFFGQRSSDNINYLFLDYADGGELFDRIGMYVHTVRHQGPGIGRADNI